MSRMPNQNMSKIGLFEAISGDLILRGRSGQRDVMYPIERAVRNFRDMHEFYMRLQPGGVTDSTAELRDVLLDYGNKILEANAQRFKLNRAPVPPSELENIRLILKMLGGKKSGRA